jgi:SEC-C motif-containing protein
MVDGEYGRAVEEGVRQIAAQLGVADFVYTVPQLAKGTGSREVGDVLLISNGRGAILQVKTRKPDSRSEDGASWVASKGGKAYRQGSGTRRQIGLHQTSGAPVIAFPVRAVGWSDDDRQKARLVLDMDVSSWPTIIIVDHPDAEGVVPTQADAFWITTEDWLWLNRALRSVTGLLIYVERILRSDGEASLPLGHEGERFGLVIDVDAAFAAARGGRSSPWLSADSLKDPTGAELYRELLQRLWPEDSLQPPQIPIEDMRRVLDFLDGVPPSMQVEVGRWILRKRSEIGKQPWASGAVMFNDDRLFVFGCSRSEVFEDIGQFDAQLGSLALVRAEEVRLQGGSLEASLAVGHLVGDGYIDYRYIFVEPLPSVEPEIMRLIRHQYGMFDLETGSVRFPQAERNDKCPCGSGRKFKYCERGSA